MRIPLLLLSLPVLLASCSSPPSVTRHDTPISDTPILTALFNPTKLTEESEEYLRQRQLLKAYRRAPDETVAQLRKEVTSDTSAARRLALIELCSDRGDVLAAVNPEKAVGYHLAAAETAYETIGARVTTEERSEIRAAYNHSAGQVASILFDNGHDWQRPATFPGPDRSYRLSSRTRGKTLVDPGQFDEMAPASHLEFKNINLQRIRREGVGAALVLHQKGTDARRKANPLLPAIGMSLPVNATLNFSQGGAEATIVFHDLLVTKEATVGGRSRPLAADLTAPFGLLMNHRVERHIGLSGLLHPEKAMAKMGLYQLEPFRPDQIPVIFVHGLMSSPETWITALNELRADPFLQSRYQLLVFRYPTGYPIPYNAAALRRRIAAFKQLVDPSGRNPNLKNMILIGHSMGGILSNAQIRDSGDTFTRRMFDRPISEVRGLEPEQRAILEEMLVYRSNPDITRAVFVASPHRGSEIARNPIGALGSRLVRFPLRFIGNASVHNIEGLTPGGRKVLLDVPDSIDGLRPDAQGTAAILEQKIRPGVTIHSIIGRKHPEGPLTQSTDGVVPYPSAHLDEAVSEKVVNATHVTITGNMDAVREVGRILYLHAGRQPPR